MNKRAVLITGAAGFIGRHVAKEFAARGWQVSGIGRSDWKDWHDYGLTAWHSVDVTSEALLEYGGKPEVLAHFAGGAAVGYSVDHPGEDFESTVQTTSRVLEFIRLHSADTKLVYPSSAAVYGQAATLPISEESTIAPISPYGLHKQMAESLCQLYSRQYGLSISIVRLFSVYGPGLRKQLLWEACRKLHEGQSEFFGTGKELRDWLHVSDVARLLFSASMKSSPECPIVNAGSGQGVAVKDILLLIAEQLHLAIAPKFSSRPKAGDPTAYVADISKARGWGWEPEGHWREGVAEYVDWYKRCR
jgi:UDP-glucose 4-epimerase